MTEDQAVLGVLPMRSQQKHFADARAEEMCRGIRRQGMPDIRSSSIGPNAREICGWLFFGPGRTGTHSLSRRLFAAVFLIAGWNREANGIGKIRL
jgi:hypothetical protein